MSVSEKRIKNSLKRILKKFPQYKSVDVIDNADLAVIYNITDTEKFQILAINSQNKERLKNETREFLKVFYFKHKNQRNRRQLVNNDVDKKHFALQG